jgi:hypothetical protein
VARAGDGTGEADDAVATVRRIPAGDQYRDISFSEAATELAKLRREKDAIRLGEMVEGAERKGWVRPTVLQQVAVAHARAGDVPAALRVVERLTEPAEKVRALAGVVFGNLSFGETPHEPGIALIQFAAGKKDEARKTLQKAAELAATVKLKQGREWALTAVVCVQARMGEVAAARKTAAEVSEGPARPHVLAAIARAEGKAGRGKEALSEVERVKEAAVRAHVLIHLAAGQASGGDEKGATESFRRARAIIEKLPEGERHLPAHNLASAQGEAGDYRGALATVDAFRASEEGISGVNVAFSRAQAGDYAGALKIAEGMTRDRWWKGNLLRAIAQIQTQRRREKDARAWIGKLESPLERANALLGVAEALAGVKR